MFDLLGSIESFLLAFGYAALFGMVFAESGLFFGFFFPGDSLLFTAGLLASQGIFDVSIVLIGVALCAIAGDQVGYWTGAKFGRGLFNKPKSFFFTPKHIEEAEAFYAKHGKKTIVFARFVPVVRTFAPIAAGMGKMEYKTFFTYNILGGILWTIIFVLAGYFAGSLFPQAGDWLTVAVLAIILISVLPLIYKAIRARKGKAGK